MLFPEFYCLVTVYLSLQQDDKLIKVNSISEKKEKIKFPLRRHTKFLSAYVQFI